jgi:hypothetical protein
MTKWKSKNRKLGSAARTHALPRRVTSFTHARSRPVGVQILDPDPASTQIRLTSRHLEHVTRVRATALGIAHRTPHGAPRPPQQRARARTHKGHHDSSRNPLPQAFKPHPRQCAQWHAQAYATTGRDGHNRTRRTGRSSKCDQPQRRTHRALHPLARRLSIGVPPPPPPAWRGVLTCSLITTHLREDIASFLLHHKTHRERARRRSPTRLLAGRLVDNRETAGEARWTREERGHARVRLWQRGVHQPRYRDATRALHALIVG